MQTLIPSIAALAVSTIYLVWHHYQAAEQQRRQRVLRSRVAYMLWCAANATE